MITMSNDQCNLSKKEYTSNLRRKTLLKTDNKLLLSIPLKFDTIPSMCNM